MVATVQHIAAVTWNTGDLVVVLPSAPSYNAATNCTYSGVDFASQLQPYIPGLSYRQANDPGNCFWDSLDFCVNGPTSPGCWSVCPIHPNNSGLIVGSNWTFVSASRHMYPSNDPLQGGRCVGESDNFAEYVIRHNNPDYTMRILAVQTIAGDVEAAGRQILDATNWAGNNWALPTFVVGDYNGALGSSSIAAIRHGLNVLTSDQAAVTTPTCPGFTGNEVPPGTGPNTDGTMQIGVALNGASFSGTIPRVVGFRQEPSFGLMSAKLLYPKNQHRGEAVYLNFP